MLHQMNGTALHRGVQQELVATARQLLAQDRIQDRQALARKMQIGAVLTKLKEGCGQGEWYPLLEKLGVKPRTARDLMRVSSPPPDGLDECMNLDEALDLCRTYDKDNPTESDTESGGDVPVDSTGTGHGESSNGREPGDDTDSIKAEAKARRNAPKNGAAFDWSEVEKWYGKIARLPELMVRVAPGCYTEGEHERAVRALSEIADIMHQWKKRYLKE